MTKNEIKFCEGFWEDEPNNIFSVNVALGEWGGKEDYEDEQIFFYMDGEPLELGATISEGFVITYIGEE